MLACPKCSRQIVEEDAVYCPYCSSQIKDRFLTVRDFPIVGGVLLIIAASVCMIIAVGTFGLFFTSYSYLYFGIGGGYYLTRYEDLFIGLFGIIAFVYGFGGGILSLEGRRLRHGVRSAVLVTVEGFLIVLAFGQQWPNSWLVGVALGVPIIILAGTALLFIAISRPRT